MPLRKTAIAIPEDLLSAIDRARLADRVGVVGEARMRDVLEGLALLLGTEESGER